MLKNKFLSFIFFAFVSYSASLIGGIITYTSKEPWYSTLIKPSFNPPAWVFAPVWSTLYLFMTVAIWLSWHKDVTNNKLIHLYLIHLIFNATWSIVFFYFHNIFLALLNIMVIIFFILLLMSKYKKISTVSFYLMIPYLMWCCYAFTLNLSLLYLN
tara:strand:+ start:174 stop:641 length:468 start_codon:yes stop_codon:yes gene_type:complete